VTDLRKTNMTLAFSRDELDALTAAALVDDLTKLDDNSLKVALAASLRMLYDAIAQKGLRLIDMTTFTMAMQVAVPMFMDIAAEHKRRRPEQYFPQWQWQSSIYSTVNHGNIHPRERGRQEKVGTDGKAYGAQESSQEEKARG
jgi:hypothetical protein